MLLLTLFNLDISKITILDVKPFACGSIYVPKMKKEITTDLVKVITSTVDNFTII